MPGFLTGVQEGMGGKSDDSNKDKKKDDGLGRLAKTVGKEIATKFGKQKGPSGTATSAGGDVGGEANVGGYKRGGKVRKTGLAKVHKGERVLTAKQAKRMEKKRGRGKSY